MALGQDHSKMSLRPYDVYWGTDNIGFCKDVDPSNLSPLTVEKKTGQFGPIVLDRVHLGIEAASISLVLNQVDAELIRAMMPWAAVSGAFALSPMDAYYSEYANSKVLKLHPHGVNILTLTDDITLLKAFPRIRLPKGNPEGGVWKELPAVFNCYPDQSLLPQRVWGYYGGLPA